VSGGGGPGGGRRERRGWGGPQEESSRRKRMRGVRHRRHKEKPTALAEEVWLRGTRLRSQSQRAALGVQSLSRPLRPFPAFKRKVALPPRGSFPAGHALLEKSLLQPSKTSLSSSAYPRTPKNGQCSFLELCCGIMCRVHLKCGKLALLMPLLVPRLKLTHACSKTKHCFAHCPSARNLADLCA